MLIRDLKLNDLVYLLDAAGCPQRDKGVWRVDFIDPDADNLDPIHLQRVDPPLAVDSFARHKVGLVSDHPPG